MLASDKHNDKCDKKTKGRFPKRPFVLADVLNGIPSS